MTIKGGILKRERILFSNRSGLHEINSSTLCRCYIVNSNLTVLAAYIGHYEEYLPGIQEYMLALAGDHLMK